MIYTCISLVMAVILGILLYLLGSFVAADFDIRNWSEFGRFMLGLIWSMGVAICLSTAIDLNNKEK